ncbi:MAG TPA: hypothetical protein VHM70_15385 [Polyangiaceae bacterium]|jgi:hypothetical protein|nr:hypothetical protein [Polyangiaceae bacterium]
MRKLAIAMLVLMPLACAKKTEHKKEDNTAKVSAEDTAKKEKEAKDKAAKEKEAELAGLVEQLKTKEDFEDQSEVDISNDNLEAELAKLEGQLDVEAPEPATSAAPVASTLNAASVKAAPAKSGAPKPSPAPKATP